jgi:teichuronic acid biosynthesis glycosyltransferase TuaC
MRVLAITKIFPNRLEPFSAPFNRQQFAALARYCELEVLASIPWFPGARAFARWSGAGKLCGVPSRDSIEGLSVRHPRFLFVPKVGHSIAGHLYAASLRAHVLEYKNKVDVVLGSWAYPDGFAAVMLAQLLGVPAVVKLHGSDMNVVARWPGPRKRLCWALPRAARVIAVSQALARAAEDLGVLRERIAVVPNGIDTARFQPAGRDAARKQLRLEPNGTLVLYVGRVERSKGVFELVQAYRQLAAHRADARLAIVGDGPALAECKRSLEPFADRVTFAGARPHQEIPAWLAACDVFTLPSWNEGMPNVVLEAIACGRRVVATRVGAIPEILYSKILGEVVSPRAPGELSSALERALAAPYDPSAVQTAAKIIDWNESARGIEANLRAALCTTTKTAA